MADKKITNVPSAKSEQVENHLEQEFGFNRRDNITTGGCAFSKMGSAMAGCHGDEAGEKLHDAGVEEIERREYAISGICVPCQRGFFVDPEGDDE